MTVLVLVLGLNVWLAMALLPAWFVGFTSGLAVLALAFPLAVLIAAGWRRSQNGLLVAFPAALLLPMGMEPQIMAHGVYGPWSLVATAIGLCTYLVGASMTTREAAPPAMRQRALGTGTRAFPARHRVYAMLTVAAVVIPAGLFHAAAFDNAYREALRVAYPGRLGSMSVLLVVAALATWLVVYRVAFTSLLTTDRRHDPALARELTGLRAGRRNPRARFWLAALAGALAMAAYVLRV